MINIDLLLEILKYSNIFITPIVITVATYWLKKKIDSANQQNKLMQDMETAKELKKLKQQLDNANFPNVLSQLALTTDLVEEIKNDISNKQWVGQQFFPIKQNIMHLITQTITDVKELVYYRNQKHSMYHNIFHEHCDFSGGGFGLHPTGVDPKYLEEIERMENEYWTYADKQIELEKSRYDEKYCSPESNKKEDLLLKSVLELIDDVSKEINLNQAVLSKDTVQLIAFFEQVKEKVTNPLHYYGDNDLSERDWSEHLIDENEKFLAEIDRQHQLIIELTKIELKLIH